MTKASVFLVVVASLLGGSPAVGSNDDWVLIELSPREETVVDLSIEGSLNVLFGANPSEDPRIVGFGTASPAHADLSLSWLGGDQQSVRTSRDLGSARFEVRGGGDPSIRSIDFDANFGGRLGGDQAFAILIFVTADASLAPLAALEVSESSGLTLEVSVSRGSGSRAVSIAHPRSDGHVVEAGGAATGSVTFAEELPTGIVGGFPGSACKLCLWDWAGPAESGDSFAVASVDLVLLNLGPTLPAFAGPQGPWRWTLSGMVNVPPAVLCRCAPILIAFAPVGSLWSVFAAEAQA